MDTRKIFFHRCTGIGFPVILGFLLVGGMLAFTSSTSRVRATGGSTTVDPSTWENMGLYGGGIQSAVVDPDTDFVYLVLNGYPGFYRSTDLGHTWQAVEGFGSAAAQRIIQADDGSLFANFGEGLQRSLDQGLTWTMVVSNSVSCPKALTIPGFDAKPGEPDYLVIGTGAPAINGEGTVYVLPEGNTTCIEADISVIPEANIVSVAFDRSDPEGKTVYAASNVGWDTPNLESKVYKSTDGGLSFSPIFTATTGEQVQVVAASVNGLIFVGTTWNLYKSEDGLEWQVADSERALPTNFVFFSPHDPQSIYTAGNRSLDGGLTWESFFHGVFFAQSKLNPQIIFTSSPMGIQRSLDGGETWEEANTGIEGVLVWKLASDPWDNQILFVATGSGMGRTLDAGRQWEFPHSGLNGGYSALAADPRQPGVFYAGGGNRVYHITDYGANRTDSIIFPRASYAIQEIVVDPNLSGNIYLALGSYDSLSERSVGGVLRSDDGGQTWLTTTLDGPAVNTIAAATIQGQTVLYAGVGDYFEAIGPSGVYRSIDSGVTWNPIGLEGLVVGEIAIHPSDPQVLFAAINTYSPDPSLESALYRSLNGGQTWEPVSLPPGIWNIGALAIDPNTPEILYLSFWNSVYKSTDGGDSWTLYYEGNPGDQILSINIPLLPPSTVTNVSVSQVGNSVVLSWTNPIDPSFEGVNLRVLTDTFPTAHIEGILLATLTGEPGSQEIFTHTNLISGTTYYYSMFSYDSNGRYSPPASITATVGISIPRSSTPDQLIQPNSPTDYTAQKYVYLATSQGLYRNAEGNLERRLFLPLILGNP